MGYYTDYQLSWKPYNNSNVIEIDSCQHTKPDGARLCSECGLLICKIDMSDAISDFLRKEKDIYYGVDEYGETTDSVEWYDHDEDIKELSKKFPLYLFSLNGKGEESDDIWIEYYLNGKMQRCEAKIIFDEFDESKLK